MEHHEDVPSEVEATSLAELRADGAVVGRLLDVNRRAEVPAPREVVAIPDSAVAVVSGLDAYGD